MGPTRRTPTAMSTPVQVLIVSIMRSAHLSGRPSEQTRARNSPAAGSRSAVTCLMQSQILPPSHPPGPPHHIPSRCPASSPRAARPGSCYAPYRTTSSAWLSPRVALDMFDQVCSAGHHTARTMRRSISTNASTHAGPTRPHKAARSSSRGPLDAPAALVLSPPTAAAQSVDGARAGACRNAIPRHRGLRAPVAQTARSVPVPASVCGPVRAQAGLLRVGSLLAFPSPQPLVPARPGSTARIAAAHPRTWHGWPAPCPNAVQSPAYDPERGVIIYARPSLPRAFEEEPSYRPHSDAGTLSRQRATAKCPPSRARLLPAV
ncbi:hypothetical protein C2E23DRAFT_61415 [Lenzites betulinus]|nr:hypothetical protein C2E23DRAFT_61415 [Lenzites betulinus]